MERRDLLRGIGVAAAVAATAPAEGQTHQHSHGAAKHQSLVDSASGCVSKGEVCLDHCHELLAQGDKTLGACAKSVSQLVAVCGALRSLAAQDAPALPKLARVAADVCKDCEAECRKHEKTHQVCKDCAEACAACATECKKLA